MSTETIQRPRAARPEDVNGGAWKVIVRNDEHNTFDHVARTLSVVLPQTTVEDGYAVADRIHHTGQALVWSGHRELAEHYWEQLAAARLTMAPLERG